jgi:hypothetical protein
MLQCPRRMKTSFHILLVLAFATLLGVLAARPTTTAAAPPPAPAALDDGDNASQGQGDNDTSKKACGDAMDACRDQLSCSKDQQAMGKCMCWKGGENGYVCTVQCSCKEPNS